MCEDSLLAVFNDVDDPRMDRTKKHPISEILFLCLCGVICGAQSWCAIEEFGNDRINWLRKFFSFQNGVPSHDTIGRVMSIIDTHSLVKAYIQFMSSMLDKPEEEIIALDGKALRRSFDKKSGQKPIHILNAWAVNSGISIGCVEVDGKSNEITSVPELLDMIEVKGAIITADALNTQRNITEKIIEKGADFTLAVKKNQPKLYEEVVKDLETTHIDKENPDIYWETHDKGHGREEHRKYTLLPIRTGSVASNWTGVKSIGKVESSVKSSKGITEETRYYILSFDGPKAFADAVRGHWGVENSLHWSLDVVFREDECRVRKDNAPANFSTIRKLALNLLRKVKTSKASVPIKQQKANRNTDFLESILRLDEL